MQTVFGFRLRVSLAAILVTASLICTVLALPRAKANAKCKSKQDGAYDECCKQHNNCATDAGGSWLKSCAEYALGVYNSCMKNAGYPVAANPSGGYPTPTPRPRPGGLAPPTNVGNNPGPGESPINKKPILPVSGPVTNKGPVSSPTPTPQTIFAKKKSTPTSNPTHHHHH